MNETPRKKSANDGRFKPGNPGGPGRPKGPRWRAKREKALEKYGKKHAAGEMFEDRCAKYAFEDPRFALEVLKLLCPPAKPDMEEAEEMVTRVIRTHVIANS